METSQIEKEFIKIKKCINSVKHSGQIQSCEKLIKLFSSKHFEEDMTNDEELQFGSEVRILSDLMTEKIKKYKEP
jgi:hypothetical protein